MNNIYTIQKPNSVSKYLGISGIIVSLFLLFFYSNCIEFFIYIGEQYVDLEGKIEANQVISIKVVIATLIILLFSISILFLFNVKFRFKEIMNKFINLNSFKSFFFNDPLSSKNNHIKYMLFFGVFIGVITHIYFLLFGTPKQEGVIEQYSTMFYPLSIILLFFILAISKSINLSIKSKKLFKYFIYLLLIGVILIYGEEISWGQRIFNWNTSGVFENYNLQNETNAHNFLNPLYRFIYPIVGMGSFLIMFFMWFFPSKEKNNLLELIIPHRSMFFLAFIMACSTYKGHSEIYEELIGVFIFLYCIRLFYCVKFPAKKTNE